MSAVAVLLAVPARAAAPASVSADTELQSAVLTKINAVRSAHGLAALKPSIRLDRAAAGHSRAMATYGFFAHESRDGTAFWKRIAQSYPAKGYRYWTVGETLLYSSGPIDAAEAVSLWMQSPPHRKVLLARNWREAGISAVRASAAPGFFDGEDVVILTADFGVRR
jgi:uncharacterized protein YkwD